jgi:uncharacterized protein involved in response to NO
MQNEQTLLADQSPEETVKKPGPTLALFCQEPFRVFFPTGLFLGVVGVLLWVLYYAGITTLYPGISHARLMIEGFVVCFIIGFLGTAGPRLMTAPHFSRAELFILLTCDLLAAGFHLGGANRAGDVLFVLCLAFFIIFLGRRLILRQDSPPPNFVLVGLSLISGLIGAALLAVFENQAYSIPYRVGLAFLEQGLPLLAIIGVAPFMLPLLLNLSVLDDLTRARKFSRIWLAQALMAASIGLAIEASFVIEALGLTTVGSWLRVAALLLYVGAQMPRTGRSFLGNCVRFGLGAIVLGYAVEAVWPQLRIGALHVVFITGFAFVIFTVATRVILGHSGNGHLFRRRLPFHIVVATLLTLAMFSRFTADLAPRARAIHLVAAAVLWLIAALVWGIRLLPGVTIVEAEGE